MQKPALNSLTIQNVLVNILCTLALTASQAAAQIAENTTETQLTQSSQPLLPLITAPQPPCQFNPNQAPEMVLLQGGYFQMGSAQDDEHAGKSEMPQHWVAIQPFALSRCEITVAQFRQFVQETGYKTTAEKLRNIENLQSETLNAFHQQKNGCLTVTERVWSFDSNAHWRNPGFTLVETHPVTCVSWWDAKAFIQWLNARTGQEYRLPSEAEWEYAARANYLGVFSFGNALSSLEYCQLMNTNSGSHCSDGFDYTAPVASFQPNGFGLYDMHGNVREWIQDCWYEDYWNAPVDGHPRLFPKTDSNKNLPEDVCQQRNVRGGSWNYLPQVARSAYRNQFERDVSYFDIGFRVARTL